MTPSDEIRLLSGVLKQIDHGPHRALQSTWLEIVMWLAVVALFLVMFQLGDRIHPLALALVSTSVGVIAGVFGICKTAARQWLVLRHHITRESVVARLAQLEP